MAARKLLGIRKATIEDLDDIVEVILAASPDDILWTYRYPYYKEHFEDTKKWTRSQFAAFLDESDIFTAFVAGEVLDDQEKSVGRPVAIALWNIRNVNKKEGVDKLPFGRPKEDGKGIRKDANPKHMEAFTLAVKEGYSNYFERWSAIEVPLMVLATHPDFQRRGAGSMLCRQGMEIAKVQGSPVTVFGSAAGTALYAHLGFTQLGKIDVQAEDEDESLSLVAMVYNAPVDGDDSVKWKSQ